MGVGFMRSTKLLKTKSPENFSGLCYFQISGKLNYFFLPDFFAAFFLGAAFFFGADFFFFAVAIFLEFNWLVN